MGNLPHATRDEMPIGPCHSPLLLNALILPSKIGPQPILRGDFTYLFNISRYLTWSDPEHPLEKTRMLDSESDPALQYSLIIRH